MTRTEPAARLAHDLSLLHCRGCRSYHAVWPYLRLIEPARGVDADRNLLDEVLTPLLQAGTSVLLAGSADAGLAECVLDAAGKRPVNLTVMDLCLTPLQQCEALLGDRAGGRLHTIQGSITGRPMMAPVDLVIAHSVLSFLSEEDLAHAAGFVGESLRPGGRLVMTTSLGPRRAAFDPVQHRRHVLAELAARAVPLPVGETAFAALLDDYGQARARRSSPFAGPEALEHWLQAAGLVVETMHDLRRGTGFAPGGKPVARMSSGVLVVARKGLAA